GPGVGKTILGIQFLMHGAEKGDKGLYVALEEQADQVREDMAEFGWDLSRIKILDTLQDAASGVWTLKSAGIGGQPDMTLRNLVSAMREKIQSYKPKRIVIDSLTSIKMLYETSADMRRDILGLMNFLLATNCTTILTSEQAGDEVLLEEFLVSGVIKLDRIYTEGDRLTSISIEKMRGSGFDKHIRPMKITDKGIVVFSNESLFR
ncbi:MAG TPA: hypothetical protein ENN13_02425, partial [Candidatus Altiarchaeales archaeon]|nr:hypothetical protein [Candidatus Altiarchaeales archaeon]